MAFRAFPEYTGQLEHYKSEGRHVVRPPDVSDQHYQQLARCERTGAPLVDAPGQDVGGTAVRAVDGETAGRYEIEETRLKER